MREIQQVLVRGYKGRGFGSSFIKWFTFAKNGVSHVSLVFRFKDGKAFEIEALQGEGVIIHEPNKEGDFVELIAPLTQQQAWECYQYAHSRIGSKYDWAGIYGFLRRKERHSEFKWFCSELVAWALWKAGYPLSRREPYQETPASVIDSLRLIDP